MKVEYQRLKISLFVENLWNYFSNLWNFNDVCYWNWMFVWKLTECGKDRKLDQSVLEKSTIGWWLSFERKFHSSEWKSHPFE